MLFYEMKYQTSTLTSLTLLHTSIKVYQLLNGGKIIHHKVSQITGNSLVTGIEFNRC